MNKNPTVALIGNPNSGKTAVFNQLTGLTQKVSNYPGVTVEKHVGTITISNRQYDITDYPGIYGIIPNSLDEQIVCKEILDWCTNKEDQPDLIVCVLDSNNISRNLYLATQILEIGIPTIFALNMIDLLQASNKNINLELLKEKLDVYDIVTCCALNTKGLIDLTQSISSFFNETKDTLNKDQKDIFEKQVLFLGWLDYEKLIRLMQICTTHVYLSYPFVLSWSLLESMSCESVIIGSNTKPVKEVIEHNKTGLLVDFFDYKEISNAISSVLSDPNGFEKIRESARKLIIDKFDLNKVSIPKYLDLIERVLYGE